MYTPHRRETHVDHTVIGHFLELYSAQQNKVAPHRLDWCEPAKGMAQH